MSDANNRGVVIRIPSYLISYENGQTIMTFIENEDDIMI
jgi:hypothetical protein